MESENSEWDWMKVSVLLVYEFVEVVHENAGSGENFQEEWTPLMECGVCERGRRGMGWAERNSWNVPPPRTGVR